MYDKMCGAMSVIKDSSSRLGNKGTKMTTPSSSSSNRVKSDADDDDDDTMCSVVCVDDKNEIINTKDDLWPGGR
jgi:hypothetical protein